MQSILRLSQPNLQLPDAARPTTRISAGHILATLIMLLSLASDARRAAAADANPPNLISYQGRVYGADDKPLAESASASYGVIFKIYKSASGTAGADLLWAEEQTVTVNDGYFSVLLGQGGAVAGLEGKHDDLEAVFKGANTSDRFIGITVKSLPGTTQDTEITPRLRLLASPYAFLARQANKLVKPDGTDGVAVSSVGKVTVTELEATDKIAALSFHGNGASLTSLNASSISSGSLNADRISTVAADKITGSGTLSDGVLSANVAKLTGAQTFTGLKTFDSRVTVNARLDVNDNIRADSHTVVANKVTATTVAATTVTAAGTVTAEGTVTASSFVGNGTIPIGGIIMWSGATVPDGWALCDGNNDTPDLRNRFVVGAGSDYAVNAKGGQKEVKLAADQLAQHRHHFDDGVFLTDLDSGDISSLISGYSYSNTSAPTIGAGSDDRTNSQLVYRDAQATGPTIYVSNPPSLRDATSHESYAPWYSTTSYYFRGNPVGDKSDS